MTRDHASINKLPDTPGVYFFVGARKKTLYIGKATSLKDRVRSYFASDLVRTRGQHLVNMVEEARRVEFRETDSVLEALILEANLIKEFKPPYNTRDKDDKSFNYLVITTHEAWPRLLTIRGKDLERELKELKAGKRVQLPVYGPFVHAGQFKEALKLIRAIFPYYDTKHPVAELKTKGDRKLRFNTSIGVYPGASVTEKEYARTIRHIRYFFEGRKQMLLRSLERDMNRYAKREAFEAAAEVKRQLFALQHINDISLLKRERSAADAPAVRIEGYDVAHLRGKDTVGVMVVVEHGEPNKKEYRTFTIRQPKEGSDTDALRELLERRFAHPEWQYPRLIVLDGSRAQQNVAKNVLADAGIEIPVVAVTKNAKHQPSRIQGPLKVRTAHHSDILLANAEAHRFSLAVHKRKRRKRLQS
jgi:excinuclease ABC subunit C